MKFENTKTSTNKRVFVCVKLNGSWVYWIELPHIHSHTQHTLSRNSCTPQKSSSLSSFAFAHLGWQTSSYNVLNFGVYRCVFRNQSAVACCSRCNQNHTFGTDGVCERLGCNEMQSSGSQFCGRMSLLKWSSSVCAVPQFNGLLDSVDAPIRVVSRTTRYAKLYHSVTVAVSSRTFDIGAVAPHNCEQIGVPRFVVGFTITMSDEIEWLVWLSYKTEVFDICERNLSLFIITLSSRTGICR